MTASTANQRLANQIMLWAWQQNLHVTRAQILRDLPTWAAAYNTATAPDRPLTPAKAAAALEIQEATVVRYLRTGRLARLSGGVSARSVAAYGVRREAGAARFPGRVVWTRQPAPPAA
jgi:hypothetical protein